jgi:hypothetical protein
VRAVELVVHVRCPRCRHKSLLSNKDLADFGLPPEAPHSKFCKAIALQKMRKRKCTCKPHREGKACRPPFARLDDSTCLLVMECGVCSIYSNKPSAPTTASAPPRSYSKPSASNPTMSLGTASRRTVRLIASSAPVSSMSGCRPKRAFQPTQRDSRPTAEPEAARLTPAKRALYSSRDERVRCPVILGCPGHLNVERDSHGRV